LTTRPITSSLVDFNNEVGLRYRGPGPCLSEYALRSGILWLAHRVSRSSAQAMRQMS
jgi:hypothetical protein